MVHERDRLLRPVALEPSVEIRAPGRLELGRVEDLRLDALLVENPFEKPRGLELVPRRNVVLTLMYSDRTLTVSVVSAFQSIGRCWARPGIRENQREERGERERTTHLVVLEGREGGGTTRPPQCRPKPRSGNDRITISRRSRRGVACCSPSAPFWR